ncbi:MAG: SOS response-associated peptidase [Christensenellaceae bacterium]|nr:SOS response-associated peptidase [Christensenellaceae bacterium]
MCGRYYIGTEEDAAWLREIVDKVEQRHRGSEALARMRLGEIFPNQVVPIIDRSGPRLMKWGYAGYGNRVINARSETAFEKPMFRRSMLERRCLIPASGYYEWKRNQSGGKTKQKFALYRPGRPMHMAGLWREEQGEALPVFVILTREAGPDIADIHDRMPVILPEQALEEWLEGPDPGLLMAQALQDMAYQPVEPAR